MRPYQFQQELEVLRIRINAEAQIPYGRFVKPNKESILPLTIKLDDFLRAYRPNLRNKQRRDLRLKMLALWTEQNVSTTYDLTVYQCSTLLNFLEQDGSAGANKRTRRFLEDSAKTVEGGDIL